MHIKKLNRDGAPASFPLSAAVTAGTTVYISGQVGVDFSKNEIVSGIIAQTKQTMDNVGSALALAGASFEDVVKVTVFLTDTGLSKEMNEVYRQYFPGLFPARSTVGVASLGHPDILVEIEAIAVLPPQ